MNLPHQPSAGSLRLNPLAAFYSMAGPYDDLGVQGAVPAAEVAPGCGPYTRFLEPGTANPFAVPVHRLLPPEAVGRVVRFLFCLNQPYIALRAAFTVT